MHQILLCGQGGTGKSVKKVWRIAVEFNNNTKLVNHSMSVEIPLMLTAQAVLMGGLSL